MARKSRTRGRAAARSSLSPRAASAAPVNEFIVTRTFRAPREMVFKAWTDARQLARWWGPRMFTVPVCETDPRPGGAFRIVMRSPDGVDYPLRGVYLEVVEPQHLVYTSDLSEHPSEWHAEVNASLPEGERPFEAVSEMPTTVTFDERGGSTNLRVRARFDSAPLLGAFLKMGLAEGWAQSLERLEEHLATD